MKDYLGYKGKVCVVTGAASGMGRACTEALVDLEARVFALDIVEVDVPGIEAYHRIDMGSQASIDAVFAKLPQQIDRFFGWAGVSGESTPPKTTITINYVSNKYLLEEVLPSRIPAETGAILMCTSVGGNRWESPVNRPELECMVNCRGWDEAMEILDRICVDLPVGNAYTYSKRCLTYLTAKLSWQYAERHIRLNALKPGNAKTGMMPALRERYFRLHPGATEADYDREFGLRGMAECSEMAEPAIFLNSDMASYITGVELLVDYGMDAAVLSGNKKEDMWTGEKLIHKYPDC